MRHVSLLFTLLAKIVYRSMVYRSKSLKNYFKKYITTLTALKHTHEFHI